MEEMNLSEERKRRMEACCLVASFYETWDIVESKDFNEILERELFLCLTHNNKGKDYKYEILPAEIYDYNVYSEEYREKRIEALDEFLEKERGRINQGNKDRIILLKATAVGNDNEKLYELYKKHPLKGLETKLFNNLTLYTSPKAKGAYKMYKELKGWDVRDYKTIHRNLGLLNDGHRETEYIIQYLKECVDTLREENEELRTIIHYSPGGEGAKEAQKEFESLM